MRTIDADALKKIFDADEEGKKISYNIFIVNGKIDSAPTIEERKTGRWILCGDEDNGNAMYKCSLCFHSDIQAKSQVVPYCWWCGAKMEGGESNEGTRDNDSGNETVSEQ